MANSVTSLRLPLSGKIMGINAGQTKTGNKFQEVAVMAQLGEEVLVCNVRDYREGKDYKVGEKFEDLVVVTPFNREFSFSNVR